MAKEAFIYAYPMLYGYKTMPGFGQGGLPRRCARGYPCLGPSGAARLCLQCRRWLIADLTLSRNARSMRAGTIITVPGAARAAASFWRSL